MQKTKCEGEKNQLLHVLFSSKMGGGYLPFQINAAEQDFGTTKPGLMATERESHKTSRCY